MRGPIFVALLLCAGAGAQPAAPVPQAAPPAVEERASREDILRLFKAIRLQKTMELVQASVRANLEQVLDTLAEKEKAGMTPEQQARLAAFRQRSRERAEKVYPLEEMLNDFVPIYQKHLSKADAEVVITFYESPVGQRLLDQLPEMMAEGMATITPKLQQRMRQLDAEIRRDAEATIAADEEKTSTPEPPKKP